MYICIINNHLDNRSCSTSIFFFLLYLHWKLNIRLWLFLFIYFFFLLCSFYLLVPKCLWPYLERLVFKVEWKISIEMKQSRWSERKKKYWEEFTRDKTERKADTKRPRNKRIRARLKWWIFIYFLYAYMYICL